MKYLLSLPAIFLFACLSCTQTKVSTSVPKPVATPVPIKQRPLEAVVSDIPKQEWEPLYHEFIEKIGRSVEIKSLRTQVIADSDLEVRIWMVFDVTRLHGFALKRTGAQWSASQIGIPVDGPGMKNKMLPLSAPKSGWDSAWDLLLEQNILTLPDAAAIDCDGSWGLEGVSYVVEILKGEKYRTYMYHNPSKKSDKRCAEADKILAIADIITTDYGVPRFRQ